MGLRQYPDKVERVVPWISKWMTLLGLKSGPSGLAWDAKERVEWAQPEYDILWAGAIEEEPSVSSAAGLCTTVGAEEATTTERRAPGTLGQAPVAAIEGVTVAELVAAAELEPGVEIPVGGVGP